MKKIPNASAAETASTTQIFGRQETHLIFRSDRVAPRQGGEGHSGSSFWFPEARVEVMMPMITVKRPTRVSGLRIDPLATDPTTGTTALLATIGVTTPARPILSAW